MTKTIHMTDIAVFVPNVIIEAISRVSDKLTATDCAILLDLVQWGAANGVKLIPVSQLAADTNAPPRSVIRSLKRLRERGLISYEHRQGEHRPAEIGLILPRKPYTRIPAEAFNDTLKAIRARELHLTSLRLLCFVWRETFGYRANHNNERQLSDSYIKERTGINRGNSNRALRELKALNAVRVFIKSQFIRGQRTEIKHFLALSVWLPPAVKMSYDPAVKLSHDNFTAESIEAYAISTGNEEKAAPATHDNFTADTKEKISCKEISKKDSAAALPVLKNSKSKYEGLEHLRDMTLDEMRKEAREYIATLNRDKESAGATETPAPVSDHKPVTAFEMLAALTPSEREDIERVRAKAYIPNEDTETAPAYSFDDMRRYAAEHGTLTGYRPAQSA